MKKINVLILSTLLAPAMLVAQNLTKPQPTIIQGHLSNYADKIVILTFPNRSADTIQVNADGNFYYKCDTITKPIRVSFSRNAVNFFTYLYIAPGYNLNLNIDTKSKTSVNLTKSVSGMGATPNQYMLKLDSITWARHDTTRWYMMPPDKLLVVATQLQKLRDSVLNAVFNSNNHPDKYSDFFKRKVQLDTKFEQLDYFTNAMCNPKIDYNTATAYVKNNFDNIILNNLYSDEYQVSDYYLGFMYNNYFAYLSAIACKKAGGCDDKYYRVQNMEAIASNYKGSLREPTLYNELYNAIFYARSFDELNIYAEAMPKYEPMLTGQSKKDELRKLFDNRYSRLSKTAAGKPAPDFAGLDTLGTSFSIADFKGKVILLDLWASWCGPCRYETPFFKQIVQKYNSDKRVAFVSIAIDDKMPDWKKALQQDKPTWLQLFDATSKTHKNYLAASIPKFIVIDKKGNVVSLDAPEPHLTAELEKMLDAEITK